MSRAAALTLVLLAAHRGPRRRAATWRASPDLWATINVCDTAANPNTIGIRGSMPGLGRRATLWMRFQVQYLAAADGRWHNISRNADSKWEKVGVTRRKVIESGQDFMFLPPPDGGSHTLRGAVTFRWMRRGHLVKKRHRITTAGHRSTAGADPPGYSAAVCQITAP